MVRGTTSRMLFLDSSVNTHYDRTKINVPPHPFSAVGSERFSLSLQQFSIRRNWLNINPTNNTGYIYLDATYHEFTITPGVYATFAELSTALQTALNATANASIAKIANDGFTVTHSSVSRKFTIEIQMAGTHTTEVQIRCLAIKSGAMPAGVSLAGGFNDIHEILGARPLKLATDDFESLTNITGANNVQQIVSLYPASLNTLDAIYIHLVAFETGNFMSTGHEAHVQDDPRLIESSLFARIPFDRSTFTEVHEVVQYVDGGNDMFQSFPLRKNMEQLEMRICDAKGRSLAQLDPTQADHGLMTWRAVLRFDIFKTPISRTGKPVGPIMTSHPPEL